MDASRDVKQAAGNPYVGPRPFQREEKDRFFGREREGRDLFSLVISERLVLFYAQSGAGKTSLINTRLVPSLEERGFEVLPVGRVSGELPPGLVVDNIFATNLMLKLDAGEDDPRRFQSLRLSDFLVNLTYDGQGFYYRLPAEQSQAATAPAEAPPSTEGAPSTEGVEEAPAESQDPYQIWPRALIIDQFEELFTGHLEAWKKREDFFIQLAEAQQNDPYLWVVLAMREDHVAQMEPYASLLPGGLRHRYYMQRLGIHAAMDAITQPVDKLRPFETLAAKKLAENLSRINAGADASGTAIFVEGESVEPVQLQVVCYQLWEALKNQPGDRITQEDLNRLARGKDLGQFVNQALADFYRDTLQKVLREPGLRLSEAKLRQWFSTELITETGTRGFVYMGAQTTGGIPNQAVLLMEGQLLRGESRAGGKWYELVHDRFIDPILQSNLEWTLAQQKPKRMFYVGAGAILLVVILFTLLIYNTGRNQTAQAVAQATAAIEAAQNSRDTTINLAATYAEVNKTLEALLAKSTMVALEAQLAGLQSSSRSSYLLPVEPLRRCRRC